MLRRLFKYMTVKKRSLAIIMIFAVSGSGLSLLAPIILGKAIDAISAWNLSTLLHLIITLGSVYVISALLQWAVPLLSARIAGRTIFDLRRDFFDKLEKLPINFFDTHKHGDIMSTVTNDMDQITEGISQVLAQIFTGVITVIGVLILMFFMNISIALAVLFITPVSILIARYITSRSSKMFRKQQKFTGSLGAFSEETISSISVIKAFCSEGKMSSRFEEINNDLYKVGQKAQFYSALVNPTTRFINNISYLTVGVLGCLFALNNGSMTIGTIATMLTYATLFAKPINEITAVTTQFQNALASCLRVFSFLDEQEETPENADMQKFENLKGKVCFNNVKFGYNSDKILIDNMNFEIPPGKIIAIVGPTGSGKTTIINLLMRFYEPLDGTILIDDTPVYQCTRQSLRNNITMVLQDTWLLGGTIHDNIAYGRPDASSAEVEIAAKKAHAHGFISKLPQGYDTVISSDKNNLSQGQQQLLTIARAMLADAPILILDEATSSVDLRTEQKIQKAFNTIMKNHTCFVIAHRLSTIKNADNIFVINNGYIQEHGTHTELLAKQGLYASIYNNQFYNDPHIM